MQLQAVLGSDPRILVFFIVEVYSAYTEKLTLITASFLVAWLQKRTRYSLCLSTLKGFEEALAHVIATEKGQPEYKCAGAIPSLSTKLDDLYRLRLKHTIDAIWAFVSIWTLLSYESSLYTVCYS